MHLVRPHRTKSVAAAMAVVLVPFVSTSSAPTAPVAQIEAAPVPGDPAAGTFAGVLARLGSQTFLAEVRGPGDDGEIAVSSPKGTRSWTVSDLSDNGLPVAAKKAYRRAADEMTRIDPGCGLPWTLLAGIGRVESDHGRYGGARLGHDGVSRPRIIGVRLDGTGPVAAIRDTDDGRLDGDKVWDRAVGPMQFIPSTWALAARDGDDDGRRSPHDLDDAAAAAASYLCSGSGSLTDPATQAAAIYRYNHDDYYVALVQAFEVGYRTGVFVLPAPPADDDEVTEKRRKRRQDAKPVKARTSTATRPPASASKKTATKTTKTSTTETGSSKPAPTPTPTKTATPKPSPTPTPPAPTEVKGLLSECAGGYCLDGKALDLGIVGQLDAQAVGDFDGDGTSETNGEELAGMLGKQVTMVVVKLDSGKLGILSINGISLA